MSDEPKTELFEKLKRFMSMTPDQRDESLWLQDSRFKSILDSEGIVNDVKEINAIINGNRKEPGLLVRMDMMEEKVKKLLKSNAALQKALYIATGAWVMVKFYFEFLHKP